MNYWRKVIAARPCARVVHIKHRPTLFILLCNNCAHCVPTANPRCQLISTSRSPSHSPSLTLFVALAIAMAAVTAFIIVANEPQNFCLIDPITNTPPSLGPTPTSVSQGTHLLGTHTHMQTRIEPTYEGWGSHTHTAHLTQVSFNYC